MKRWLVPALFAIAIILLVWVVRAEESAPLPQITVEQQRDYHRARAALLATPQQRALDDIVTAMQSVCGERGLLADAKGDPQCGTKAQSANKGN